MKISHTTFLILVMIITSSCGNDPAFGGLGRESISASEATLTGMVETRSDPTSMGVSTSLPPTQSTTSATEASQGYTYVRNATYCRMEEVQLKADIYLPTSTTEPRPLVIFVHGGGWTSGDKRSGGRTMNVEPLVLAGFAVATINYRLAPEYKMADMIADVRCAVRSFRAHASEYNIDPDRIGAWGESAGSQLAALMGTMDGSISKYDSAEYASYSSKVQAVVDLYGPSDFISLYSDGRNISLGPTTVSIFGSDDIYDPIYTDASPVSHITSDDPPFLILHGNEDITVPLSQSQELFKKLVASGVDAQLEIVKRGNHGFTREDQSPTREELLNLIIHFFSVKLNQ